ncbi:hypothetical protein CEUSTIGMA_g4352.t1 [Chlamydomonas eustigma]|uniref:peptidylprolyl isomerase n=1 Tax=Chlamydomonas eustigma TaxID=1157962 RepID=A0A250X1H8_9CHLO|nr:hypothetical protein CEUSTIGMA_g4352.t1 [Chlamydomonas eustigma]|eukprot:GAX76906.1 hypothetical protein CEUSTIGMA_g4352.t1 [Chlamydomonas eustigma]
MTEPRSDTHEDALEEEIVGPTMPIEDDVGPQLPLVKKRKVLEFETHYLEALPSSQMYERSYMHRETVTQVLATNTDFFITGSTDGFVKFWKKQVNGIEFVKMYRAHLGPVDGIVASQDGTLCMSWSRDRTAKVYDVLNFDMIVMLRLTYTPGCADWISKKGEAMSRVVLTDLNTPSIHVYDIRSGSNDPIITLEGIHRSPVTALRYNAVFDTVLSADTKGFIEYWSGSSYEAPEAAAISFSSKLDTDLFDVAKAKAVARSIEVSRDGKQLALFCSDHRVRVYRFQTGKLKRVYDESLEAAQELQRSGTEMFKLEDMDFGRRVALEKELEATLDEPGTPQPNAVFDESGNFLLYSTLLGIKIVNLVSNTVSKVLGKVENERFVRVALHQGTAKKSKLAVTMETLDKMPQRDPTIMAVAFKRQRIYLLTKREPQEVEDATLGRDVFNERPALEDLMAAETDTASIVVLPRGAILHTTKGDISLKLFPDECPRTVENFTTHAKNCYYDSVIFHRIIKGFMLQTGDPLGDGTGGESIWGGEFEDEFHKTLRHDRPGILSMANAGPGTNGSQFFITTVPCPWLDNKHTVFGRVVKGMDVVLTLEKAKVDKNDKPFEDIKISSITVLDQAPAGS